MPPASGGGEDEAAHGGKDVVDLGPVGPPPGAGRAVGVGGGRGTGGRRAVRHGGSGGLRLHTPDSRPVLRGARPPLPWGQVIGDGAPP